MTITDFAYHYTGLQNGVVYESNAKGRPKGVNGTAYVGFDVYASKTYSPSLPQPRIVPHPGNDMLLHTQSFPGQEAASAQLGVGAEDLDLLAMVTGTTKKTIAGMVMLPHMTNLQGKEKQVSVLLYQAAVSRRLGLAGYHFHMISSSKVVGVLPGAGNDPIDFVYSMVINPSENYMWGGALAPLADIYDPFSGVAETGAKTAGIFSGFSAYEPRLAAFVAGASQEEFLFPASMQAVNVTDIAVFTAAPTDDVAELVDAADYTAATTGITFDIAPTEGDEVIIIYQKAAS